MTPERIRQKTGKLLRVSLLERLRRWWKPADYKDDHPLAEEEREARQPLAIQDAELRTLLRGTSPINPEDELQPPR